MGLSRTPLPLFGVSHFSTWTPPSHTNTGIALGLPTPPPHMTVPTEGIVSGNPKGQGQALRVAVLKLGLHPNPLEDLLKHRWEQEEFLIQQAWGQEGVPR